jgi:hypothetical protein
MRLRPDWRTEAAGVDYDVAKRCLAHPVGTRAALAYDRSDRPGLCRPVMAQSWAAPQRDPARRPPGVVPVVRVAITEEACEAIVATLPIGTGAVEPKTAGQGMIYWVWVEQAVVDTARPRRDVQPRHHETGGVGAGMTRRIAHALVALLLVVAFLMIGGQSRAQDGLTCEASGDRRHCFDHHSYLSTEEWSGDYLSGWDNRGRRGSSGGGAAGPTCGRVVACADSFLASGSRTDQCLSTIGGTFARAGMFRA